MKKKATSKWTRVSFSSRVYIAAAGKVWLLEWRDQPKAAKQGIYLVPPFLGFESLLGSHRSSKKHTTMRETRKI
jgi:hypothetical protein